MSSSVHKDEPDMSAFIDRLHEFTANDIRSVGRQTAAAYNIFRLLRVEHDERTTHSRMLSDLLDPSGLHGQGNAFLKIFLNHCHEMLSRARLPDAVFDHPWIVEEERGIPTGRVDILIRCPRAGYLVVIENKIFATEQPDQLRRYHKWIKTWHDQPQQQLLIFLTPDGRSPQTGRECDCLALSYGTDVTKMLKLFLKAANPENLKVILTQYLDVIENLGGEASLGEPNHGIE